MVIEITSVWRAVIQLSKRKLNIQKPNPVGLSKETYQWLDSKKKYIPADDNWFKISYPGFIKRRFPKSVEEFYEVIAFAYSWMPTIPNVKTISRHEWTEIHNLLTQLNKKPDALEELLITLIPIINNSIVGTSKVLHFISPEHVPIIDSRVLKTWNAIFKGNPDIAIKKTMLADSNIKRQVKNYLKYQEHLIKWKKACGRNVTMRGIESLLYYQKLK